MRVWSICGVYSRAGFIFVIAFLAAAFIQGRCLIEEIRYIILYSDATIIIICQVLITIIII